ncbi:MAG: DEAD/DEAH box helicase [Pseudanabaenaceae cyanobacterium]
MPLSFLDLGISPARVAVLKELGFQEPTPIQAQAIPHLLAGADVLGEAQTGTGKTAAFSLPILEKLDTSVNALQALILAPTRELALQVTQALRSFNLRPGAKILTVYGGAGIDRQIASLERGVQIVVGTPGRVIDLMERGVLCLDSLRFFVLDEADEMLNMGFIQDVERILTAVPPTRQTAFFSATMPLPIRRLVKNYLRSPVMVKVETAVTTPTRIDQQVYLIPNHLTKEEALLPILELESPTSAIIFVRTKETASNLTELLQRSGYSADEYHGNLSQAQRESLLRRFRNQRVKWVIATDIAARGLDIDGLTHVFNLDLPDDLERYVHRIGRTGRAGKTGTAISLVTSKERHRIKQLERYLGQSLPILSLPSIAQIQANRITRFQEQMRQALTGERLASFLPLVAQLAEEYDPQAIAAAALQLAYSCLQSETSEQAILNILSKDKPFKAYGKRDAKYATRH